MNTGWSVNKGGVINRILVTARQEQPYFSEPDTLPDNVNYRFINGFVDVGTLPCRVRFLREEARRQVTLPETLLCEQLWTGGDACHTVSFSDFWPTPTHVQCFSRALLLSKEEQTVPFTLSTCGGVTLWLNGILITRFTPFTRNVEQSCAITLPLQPGKNTLIVHAEELCERDTDYLFRLCYQGESPLAWQLTEDDALSARWVALDTWLNGLSLQQTLVDRATLRVNASLPAPEAMVISHRLLCNINESLPPWQQSCALPAAHQAWQVDLPPSLVGYFDLVTDVTCAGITLKRTFSFGRLPREKIPSTLTFDERRQHLLRHIAANGFNRIGRLLAIFASGESTEAIPPILDSVLHKISRREDCADFQLVPLIWFWQRFQGQRLAAHDWRRVRSAILGFRYWIDEPGNDAMWFWSENHCLCFHVAQYLAGQNFPQETFLCSGRTGHEQQQIAYQRLTRWFDAILEHGLVEWNSAAYYPIDLIGLVALLELAQHQDLRDKARTVVDRILLMTAWVHQDGVAVGTMGRAYDKELRSGMLTELSGLCALMWGEGWLIPHCAALPLMCLSTYRAPAEADMVARWQQQQGAEARWVQGLHRNAKIIAWKQPDVALSSVFDHHPGQPGHQQHVLDVRVGPHYAARLWVNHPGEDRPDGVHRPSYWAGNGRLPAVMQHRNRAWMIFDLQQDIRPWTHLYLPHQVLDEVIVQDTWCFVRAGHGFAAFHNPAGLTAVNPGQAEGELRASGEHNVWLVAVDSGQHAQQFAAFVARFQTRLVLTNAAGETQFDDPDYGLLRYHPQHGFFIQQRPCVFSDDVSVIPRLTQASV